MPLHIDRVEPGTNSLGDPVIFCAHCHKAADYTETVGENNTLLLELMCPSGAVELATGWLNEQQRSGEIRTYLEAHKRK
jgi:hypothetical protein